MRRTTKWKGLKSLISITAFFLLLIGTQVATAAEKEWTGSGKEVPADKEWTITFNTSVEYDELSESITVKDQSGEKVKVTVEKVNDQMLKVLPPQEGYKVGESYALRVGEIASNRKVMMKDGITMKFTIAEPVKQDPSSYQELVRSINPEIRDLLVSGWDEEAFKPGDFKNIEEDLKKVATDSFVQNTLKPYFEETMCHPCDSSMFPFQIAPELHFEVMKDTEDERVFQTAELSNDLSMGSLVTYTFTKQKDTWLLDDYQRERFSGKGLDVSKEEASAYLKEDYLSDPHYGFESVDVTFLAEGTEEKYDPYTEKRHDRTYYVFEVKTDKETFKRKFYPFDGYVEYIAD
ncbi:MULTISPECIES: hypothetical protein [Pontibacillus]|uniref:SbsA Ig-like domain-containing protein n=1 Tax=Pontibacillus chungwhensis TaxID=265426 RepID=A0ABY8V0Z0_9BACI|nr:MULTISPECIES: hypothetical protein [Pontibacillus]MCD5324602.1 hypothetical protein [Pontibacillus sp. HN14]WIF99103.1 hypothetical protein QNI29_05460 [Pontibacillus chungwhensis]